MAARGAMPGAGVLAAHGTSLDALRGEHLAVHVALLAVCRTGVRAGCVDQWLEVGDAMSEPSLHALGRVVGADELPARAARPDLIGREDRCLLLRAARPMLPADQAPGRVGTAQVRRAVHLSIHGAHGAVRRADQLAAARALRRLVHTHPLPGPALTGAQARRAETTASLWRVRVALLGVPVAHDPAAAAARRQARGPGRVRVLGAHTLVRRAVLQPARGAYAGVLVTRRLPVHATLGEAALRAAALRAD